MLLQRIFSQFIKDSVTEITALTSGHINDTYLVEAQKDSYVLQKLNHLVFQNIPELMNNKLQVSEYLRQKPSYQLSILHFYPSLNGKYFFQDDEKNYWSLMNYIPETKVLEKTQNAAQAKEAGKAFGHFIAQLNDFDATQLFETIPDFHKMSSRYSQFEEAFINASEERKNQAIKWIEQVRASKKKMHQLENLYEQGEIPVRVTHNDTKLSNLLFNSKNKAIAVIDWDTLMPGIVHNDFGDSIRSICSSTTEDETDLTKVQFNEEFYESYKTGFLDEIGSVLSKKELDLLPLAAETITFIMGLRFLTDFLNNDIYYKIKYPNHNLDRAANQLTLVKRMEDAFS